MDSLDEKINEIVEKRTAAINETPDERREANLKELHSKLIEARSTYASAPLNVDIAEKQYYTLKDGADGYNQRQLKKYSEEAKKIKKDLLKEHNTSIKSTLDTMSYYNSQKTYSNNVNTVKLSLLENIKHKVKKIKHEQSNKTTNNRKTYYVIEEQDSVIFWLQVINYCLISFIIVFIIYSVRENHVTNYTYIFVISGLIIVFFLEPLIQLIKSIPLSFNVYTAWAEDTEKPTNIFYIVLVISILLFGIIYKKNQDIDNYFK